MNSRERVLDALERKPVDQVPYVETTIGLKIGEALLGHSTLDAPAIVRAALSIAAEIDIYTNHHLVVEELEC